MPRTRPTVSIDEADLLRTAALITELLSDRRLHPWRECADLAREFTGGQWSPAFKLAWHAASTYITARLVWVGESGERWVGRIEAVYEVECPKCGADAYEPCRALRSNGQTRTGDRKSWPHEQREMKAWAESHHQLSALWTRERVSEAVTRSTSDELDAEFDAAAC